MRVLVTGSRKWTDWRAVYQVLTTLCVENNLMYPPDEYGNTMPDPAKITVVHGNCPTGADRHADEWCIGSYFVAERHPADWNTGKGAGFKRNAEMVNLGADLCLAFIKNNSKGATHTADLAEKAGIRTVRYTQDSGT